MSLARRSAFGAERAEGVRGPLRPAGVGGRASSEEAGRFGLPTAGQEEIDRRGAHVACLGAGEPAQWSERAAVPRGVGLCRVCSIRWTAGSAVRRVFGARVLAWPITTSGRGGETAHVWLEQRPLLEQGDEDEEESIDDTSDRSPMGVATGSQRRVVSLGAFVVVHAVHREVMHCVSKAAVACSPHRGRMALAALVGHRCYAAQRPQTGVVSGLERCCRLCEHRGADKCPHSRCATSARTDPLTTVKLTPSRRRAFSPSRPRCYRAARPSSSASTGNSLLGS